MQSSHSCLERGRCRCGLGHRYFWYVRVAFCWLRVAGNVEASPLKGKFAHTKGIEG